MDYSQVSDTTVRVDADTLRIDIGHQPGWRATFFEESGKSVKIYVENFNPARRLYDRLGFQHADTNGVYHIMRWTAGGA